MGTIVDLEFPNGGIVDADVSANADISGTKITRQQGHTVEVFDSSTLVEDVNSVLLHQVYGATAKVIAFEASIFTVGTSDHTVTVKLQKANAGSDFSELSGDGIVITSTTSIRTPQPASIETTALSDGDILRAVVEVSDGSGTAPKGLLLTLTYQESPTS